MSKLFYTALAALLALTTAQSTIDSMMTGTEAFFTTEAPITEFSLELKHFESSTSFIRFYWVTRVPAWMTLEQYVVKSNVVGSQDITTSPVLPGSADRYELANLINDEQFQVCLHYVVSNGTLSNTFEDVSCTTEFKTIPYLRLDSVIALLCVLGYLGLMILIGYISWRCAVRRQLKALEEAAEEAAEEDEED